MADSNNNLAANLPEKPYPELGKLDLLVGKWEATGWFLHGVTTFESMEGGFFLIQRGDARGGGRQIKGVEYISFDEETQTLRSHYWRAAST